MATIRSSICVPRSTYGRIDNPPPRFRPGNYGTNHDKTRRARQAAADFVVLLLRAFPSHGLGLASFANALAFDWQGNGNGIRALSSAGERSLHTREVVGSIPTAPTSSPTLRGDACMLAHLVRDEGVAGSNPATPTS